MKFLKLILAITAILLIFSCVDDDQLVEESNLETEERQAGLGDGWVPAPCANITLYIDPDACGPNWEASLPDAIAEYNNIPGVAIQMQQVMSPPADIEITCADFANNNSFGLGEWPDADGVIGGNIFMNTDFENSCTDPCFHAGSMMHEISHNLGFCHGEQEGLSGNVGPWILNANGTFTQVNTGQVTPLEHIPGTPTGLGDPNSIFNVHDCADPNCVLSPDDIIALQSYYPCENCTEPLCNCPISPSIVGPNSFCAGDEASFCVTGIAQGWSLSTGSGSCFDVSFPDPGNQTISVDVCLDDEPDCCVSASIDVEVREKKDGIKCLCVCEAQEQSGRKNPIELWEVEVDCCDDRPCSELIPGWWIEYLIDDRECFKKEEIIPEVPCEIPNVGLSGPNKICLGDSGTFCITGLNNGQTTWQISGVGTTTTSTDCLTFTPSSTGTYTISTTVCKDDCCETFSREVKVTTCEVECYCECEDGQSGDIIELIYDCNEVGDCQDIFYEDDIYNCRQLTRIL